MQGSATQCNTTVEAPFPTGQKRLPAASFPEREPTRSKDKKTQVVWRTTDVGRYEAGTSRAVNQYEPGAHVDSWYLCLRRTRAHVCDLPAHPGRNQEFQACAPRCEWGALSNDHLTGDAMPLAQPVSGRQSNRQKYRPTPFYPHPPLVFDCACAKYGVYQSTSFTLSMPLGPSSELSR